MKRKRRYRRGYPVAVLVGFEDTRAMLWQVFSRVVKPLSRINIEGKRTDEKALYTFYESIVNSLKPILTEGVRSIVVTSPARTTYATNFLDHIQKHHRYMIQSKSVNRAHFAEMVGSAGDKIKVAELVKTKEFTDLVAETTAEEADQVVDSLEKYLYAVDGNSVVLYSLKEIEDMVYKKDLGSESVSVYLLLTDKYLVESKHKSRIHRLMQIARNKKVKTNVVNAETSAGTRIGQFGGIIFFTVPDRKVLE